MATIDERIAAENKWATDLYAALLELPVQSRDESMRVIDRIDDHIIMRDRLVILKAQFGG